MTDAVADAVLRRHDGMVSARAPFEELWRIVGERVDPDNNAVFGRMPNAGEKRTQRLFDSTAGLALQRFTAAINWVLTPANQRWSKLTVTDKKLRDNSAVKRYLEDVNDVLFAARNNPNANFAEQQVMAYRSIGSFGTGAVFVDEEAGKHLRYRALHLSQFYLAEDASGRVDTIHRPFEYTARQAMQDKNIDPKLLPDIITQAAKDTPDRRFPFIHCVYPNTDRLPGRKDFRGMAFRSVYISVQGKKVVGEGGFRTFPFTVGRYARNPFEIYGRSPAIAALPSILTLNEQEKTILRAGQKIVDPPLLLSDDGALMPFDLRSGALNYGTLTQDGQPKVQPLVTNARIDIGLDLMQRNVELINDHFLVTLFQIFVESPQMTATEAMLRAQEKGALLTPTMGALQTGMLAPQIEREIDIMFHAGQLPDMPDEMIEAGGEIEIVYESPLSRAQKAEEAAGVLNLWAAVATIGQQKPEAYDKLDIEAGIDVLGEAYGTPAKTIVPPEVVEARRKARQEAAEMEQALDAAPIAASAAKDLMSAQAMAGSLPNNQGIPA